VPTTRRYTFTHPGSWEREGGHEVFDEVMAYMCDRYWWYRDHQVDGSALGVMVLSFTVSGEEQWRVHRRAMHAAATCYHKAGLSKADIPVPTWVKLDPHTHRGRYRVTG